MHRQIRVERTRRLAHVEAKAVSHPFSLSCVPTFGLDPLKNCTCYFNGTLQAQGRQLERRLMEFALPQKNLKRVVYFMAQKSRHLTHCNSQCA